ncbi:NADPH-dependent FMN reductase [Paenibacillus sp. WLX2291]|uniref:NADPH-dependent FMN reductase n=1 Tax=Paenibacillus sp. WLX2291 TaxID=3296934 RepID=UPI0039845C21
MSKITIISGSPNTHSRLNGLIRYAQVHLEQQQCEVDIIHVASLPAEHLVHAQFDSPAIMGAHERVAQADGIIIASPVYKASCTGVLKSYLDLLPQKAFRDKTIAIYFVGGSSAAQLSIDYAMKPILSSMGAKHFAANVFACEHTIERMENDAQHQPIGFRLTPEIEERLHLSLHDLLHSCSSLKIPY